MAAVLQIREENRAYFYHSDRKNGVDTSVKKISAVSAIVFAAGLMLIWLTGCAYLNTFYNGRTAYNTARRAHKKLLRVNPDSAETLPQRISDLYDRAIDKSLKVLEVYPKSKKWHDDAVFLMARAAFYKGEMPAAIRRFRRLQREFPKSPFIPESYMYLGKAYLGNENLIKAEETFEFILEKYPELNANDEITLLLAQVAIQRQGKAQAIELLEKTLASVKTPEKKMKILLQIAELYMGLRQYEKAISVLKKAPRKKNFPDYLYKIDFALLVCYGESGKYDAALKLSGLMMKNRQYISHYPEILFQKGLVLKRAGRLKEAIGVFEQITKGLTAPAVQGLAWYELALIYQHEYGDFVKAKECYDKAMSLSTDTEIREIAQTRSKAISEIDAFQKLLNEEIAEKDTTDSADTTIAPAIDTSTSLDVARYKMGEIYWLHLEEPDSALLHFDIISSDTSAGDTLQTKALFSRAWITLHMKDDTASAESLFTLIIKTHPATLFAKRSQQQLGVPVTVKTREDSAHLEMIKAEKLFYEESNALGASRAYLRVSQKYPDLDIAAQCIYAAAWLCDDVLHKNVTARKLYRTLCDSFPKSDLCLSYAKPRLQIVEDTLAAIKARKKKQKESEPKGKRRSSKKKHSQDEKEAAGRDDESAGDDTLLGEDTSSDSSLSAISGDSTVVDTADVPKGTPGADSTQPRNDKKPAEPVQADSVAGQTEKGSSEAGAPESLAAERMQVEKAAPPIKKLPVPREQIYTNTSDSAVVAPPANRAEDTTETKAE